MLKGASVAKVRNSVLLFALLAVGAAGHAQELELKGMKPGDAMSACPPDSTVMPSKNPETVCSLGPTTLANQEVLEHAFSIYDGQIIAIMYSLAARGPDANGRVREALIEKYGQPYEAKYHVNEYTWRKGSLILTLDGWRGHVVLMDRLLVKKARDAAAKSGKSDI